MWSKLLKFYFHEKLPILVASQATSYKLQHDPKDGVLFSLPAFVSLCLSLWLSVPLSVCPPLCMAGFAITQEISHWLSCTVCCQYLLDMKYLIYGPLFLQLSTSLGCFRPWIFFLKKRFGLLVLDIICFIFTYYTQDNQQVYFRLGNWFSLQCLGPWTNHLLPVWWSNFNFMFLKENWCVSLT